MQLRFGVPQCQNRLENIFALLEELAPRWDWPPSYLENAMQLANDVYSTRNSATRRKRKTKPKGKPEAKQATVVEKSPELPVVSDGSHDDPSSSSSILSPTPAEESSSGEGTPPPPPTAPSSVSSEESLDGSVPDLGYSPTSPEPSGSESAESVKSVVGGSGQGNVTLPGLVLLGHGCPLGCHTTYRPHPCPTTGRLRPQSTVAWLSRPTRQGQGMPSCL